MCLCRLPYKFLDNDRDNKHSLVTVDVGFVDNLVYVCRLEFFKMSIISKQTTMCDGDRAHMPRRRSSKSDVIKISDLNSRSLDFSMATAAVRMNADYVSLIRV